jgi:hypothetical protein
MDIIGIIGFYDIMSLTMITMQAGAPTASAAAAGAGEMA